MHQRHLTQVWNSQSTQGATGASSDPLFWSFWFCFFPRMIKRCNALMGVPPPAEWDGTWDSYAPWQTFQGTTVDFFSTRIPVSKDMPNLFRIEDAGVCVWILSEHTYTTVPCVLEQCFAGRMLLEVWKVALAIYILCLGSCPAIVFFHVATLWQCGLKSLCMSYWRAR